MEIDESTLTTKAVFVPLEGYPSAGDPDEVLASPRRIVINIPPTVVDLAGNPMLPGNGGGVTSFVPERIRFEPVELPREGGEDFTNNDLENEARSSAEWGGGRLAPS